MRGGSGATLLLGLVLVGVVASSGAASEEPGTADAENPSSNSFMDAEEMVVSASRASLSFADVPSLTTVLEGEALESSVSTSIADALRFVPGLQLTQEGARGGRAQIALRGLDPNHVVVLVDGVRLNDPTNSRGGSFDPTTLALLDIDRVEIVRGPLSSVYGSDALAGAINIITKTAAPGDAWTTRVRARGGRFHSGNIAAETRSGLSDFAGISLGAALDTFRDPNSDGGYDGASLKMKIDAELPAGFEFEGFARFHESSARGFPESSGGPELSSLRAMEDRQAREILFGIAIQREFFDRARVTLRASRNSRRDDRESPGIDPVPPFNPFADVPPSREGSEYRRWDVSLTTDWELPGFAVAEMPIELRVVAGADGVFEDGESDVSLDFSGTGAGPFSAAGFFDRRETLGVFGEVQERIGEHVVFSGGIRFDSTPDEEDRISPSAGLTVDLPGTDFSAFASYHEGFKRPSFYALQNPLVGNQNLGVEKSRGWEVGLRGKSPDGTLSGQISYFDILVDDIIIFDPTRFRLRNENRLISRGVELELDWRAGHRIHLRGGVTFNPTDFDGTSLAPENRSRWRGYAEVALRPIEAVEIDLRTLFVGPSKASSFHTGSRVTTLAGYERVDLRIRWSPLEELDLLLEIENLTNRTYREAVGFEAPGIMPRLGLVLRR